jgi:flagellar biosynthetic protein FliO
MTLCNSIRSFPRRFQRQVTRVRSLHLSQLLIMPFPSSLAPTLTLIATLLLIGLMTPLASAQDIPSTTEANTQVLLPEKPPQPQRIRVKRPAPDAPEEAAPTPAPVAAVSPEPAPVASPSPADDRLPFMATEEREGHGQPPSAMGLLVRTLGALLLIVGLIVAAAWGMKRFGGARFGTPLEDAPPLAVLNSLSLGERRSLTIVRFGDRTLLLGSTPQAVTLLAEAETENFSPQPRSVADILGDETPAVFSHELFRATEHLDEQTKTPRGSHSTR